MNSPYKILAYKHNTVWLYRIDDLNNVNIRLSSDLAELNAKLQQKETAFSQLDMERKSCVDNIEHLKHQVDCYRNDFDAERNAREQLTMDNQRLKQQLKEREEQFHTFNDFTTDRFAQERLSRDNDQLQRQIDQITSECEQLKKLQQQKDERLYQLSNQIATELQIKESVVTESQNLRDKLQAKEFEIHQLNNTISMERQQCTTEADRFREHIHSLKQTMDAQQKELLQVCYTCTNTVCIYLSTDFS